MDYLQTGNQSSELHRGPFDRSSRAPETAPGKRTLTSGLASSGKPPRASSPGVAKDEHAHVVVAATRPTSACDRERPTATDNVATTADLHTILTARRIISAPAAQGDGTAASALYRGSVHINADEGPRCCAGRIGGQRDPTIDGAQARAGG